MYEHCACIVCEIVLTRVRVCRGVKKSKVNAYNEIG